MIQIIKNQIFQSILPVLFIPKPNSYQSLKKLKGMLNSTKFHINIPCIAIYI